MENQTALLPSLSKRQMLIILEHETNDVYFKYLWVIILNAHSQGTKIALFDCDWDNLEYSNRNHDENRLTKVSKIRDSFLNGLSTFTKGAIQIEKVNANDIQINRNRINGIKDFLVADQVHPQFGNSLRSVFARDFLSSSNFTLKGRGMHKQFRIHVQSFLSMQMLCQNILDKKKFDLFLIANGRYPTQTAMRIIAEENKMDFICYEHGMPKGESFHFAPFQTQEFGKMQQFIKSQIEMEIQDRKQEIESSAIQWLENQETNLDQNPFITRDSKQSLQGRFNTEKPLAVIFNSSIDEKFSNMGVNLNGWESQKQATLEISKALNAQGFEVLVRIHPNTANKSWWDLVNLVGFLKRNRINFILPWDGPSSYALLKEARIILTWGSTISMEAVARGIPTIVYGRTMYDEIAGAIIVTPNLLTNLNFQGIGKSDPSLGRIAAYFNKNWGHKLVDYCAFQNLEAIDAILGNDRKNLNVKGAMGSRKILKFYRVLKLFKGLQFWINRLRKGRYSKPNDLRFFLRHFLPQSLVDQTANFVLGLGLKSKALQKDGEVSI